jgi:hypothetical protein
MALQPLAEEILSASKKEPYLMMIKDTKHSPHVYPSNDNTATEYTTHW